MKNVIKLRLENAWVGLRPIGEKAAEVVDGNTHAAHDIVIRPDGITWNEAAEVNEGRNTRLSPFDLELIYDRLTDWKYRPEANEAPLADIEDPRPNAAFQAVEEKVDEEMAAQVHAALAVGQEVPEEDIEDAA